MSDSKRAGRIFLANVGVNAAHRLVSPLADDGTFTLVTIPEARQLEGLVRYGDVPRLRAVVPERYWPVATHYDPEFETLTYGDNCGWAPRAAALKACRPGDSLFFIARLVGRDGPVFALVGWLAVEAVLSSVRARPSAEALERFGANAHVRRALVDGAWWDGFWVFAGGLGSGLSRGRWRLGAKRPSCCSATEPAVAGSGGPGGRTCRQSAPTHARAGASSIRRSIRGGRTTGGGC